MSDSKLKDIRELLGPSVLFTHTKTNHSHSEYDAVGPFAEIVNASGLHDYEAQPLGRHPHGVVLATDYFVVGEAGSIRLITQPIVFYRTKTRGDRRFNFLKKGAEAPQIGEEFSISDFGNRFVVVNHSRGMSNLAAGEPWGRMLGALQQYKLSWASDELDATAGQESTGKKPPVPGKSQGFSRDHALNKVVETHAVKVAEADATARGAVRLKHRGAPYDMEFMLDGKEVHSEVKGSRGSVDSILITEGEVKHNQTWARTELAVVDEIEVDLGADGQWVAHNGRLRVWTKWTISSESLTPISHKHRLPPLS